MIPNRPAAVVCDMDGLLVDSERLERRVWQAAAADHGVEMSDERFATFIGNPIDVCEQMLAGYYGAGFDVDAYRETCHRHMRVIVDAEGVPMRPGALEWMEFVIGLGIPLGLATSSGPALVHERLGGQLHRFAAVVTRADVARGKPSPDIYLEAASRLRADPADCLALEDSPTGARAAIAAAMPVIIVPDMVTPPPEIVRATVGVYASLVTVRDAAAQLWGTREP